MCCHQDAFYEKHGVKLGFMSAFVKAAASALQEVPAVNGVIDGQEIIYRCARAQGLGVPLTRLGVEVSLKLNSRAASPGSR